MSYPILRVTLKDADGKPFDFNWSASEYLYRHATQKYCLAAETQSGNEIMMGGTILRQHIFAFDIAKW